MSNMMIYAALSATGGTVESVYGTKMRINTIDSSDKEAVEKAKADGWYSTAQPVIEEIEALKMQKDNDKMKGQLSDGKDKKRITELEEQLAKALTEIASLEETVTELKDKVEVYEFTKDTNGDGKVSYDEMTNKELQALLDQRGTEYGNRDDKDTLIKLAQKSE